MSHTCRGTIPDYDQACAVTAPSVCILSGSQGPTHMHDIGLEAQSVCLIYMYYLTGTVSTGTDSGACFNAQLHSIFCIRYITLCLLVTPHVATK